MDECGIIIVDKLRNGSVDKDVRKIKGKRRRKCGSCGDLKHSAYTRIDPYVQDIQGKIVYRVLCDACHYECVMGI